MAEMDVVEFVFGKKMIFWEKTMKLTIKKCFTFKKTEGYILRQKVSI